MLDEIDEELLARNETEDILRAKTGNLELEDTLDTTVPLTENLGKDNSLEGTDSEIE
jgi:hypothetical protein